MPWKLTDDLDKYKADMTTAQKKQWIATANATMARCTGEGKDVDQCDAMAIRIANGAVEEAGTVGQNLNEAATIKAKAQAALRAVRALLGEKNLPESVHKHVDALRDALKKAWADLEDTVADMDAGDEHADPDPTPKPAVAAAEAREFVLSQPAIVTLVEAQDTELLTECIPLAEKAVRADGIVSLKLIAPGKGSSGFYPADVLRRDGPKVFAAGTKCFWDHPRADEDAQRPERSLRDFAAELVTDAAYRDGPAGEGLYADAKVFDAFRASVNELAPHIGMSIRALGKARMGEVDGQKGPVIEQIVAARSVDFVTSPGAGGKVLSLFEAARNQIVGGVTVTEEEAKKLAEDNAALKAANDELQKQLAMGEAKAIMTEAIGKAELPQAAKDRLTKQFAETVPLAEGKLDSDALKQQLAEAVKAEAEYVAALKPASQTQVTGLGATSVQSAGKALKESFRSMYVKQGMSAEQAEQLATIAAQGR